MATESTETVDATVEGDTVEGDTTLAALSHASALFASFLGPILFLILADDGDDLVERNAKNSLNFQIVVFAALMIAGALSFVFVGLLLFPIIAVADLIQRREGVLVPVHARHRLTAVPSGGAATDDRRAETGR
jgi:uncharacterized Tic20 family protein